MIKAHKETFKRDEIIGEYVKQERNDHIMACN